MSNQQTELKTIMDFHGIKLPVVTHDGIDYVPLKPICNLLNLDWKSAKKASFNGDNPVLYGTTTLLVPVITFEKEVNLPNSATFIKLKRVYGYLNGVSTNALRARGNISGAEYLLKLQEEWSEALYQYETTGAAFKDSAVKDLKALIDAMHKLPAGDNKQRL